MFSRPQKPCPQSFPFHGIAFEVIIAHLFQIVLISKNFSEKQQCFLTLEKTGAILNKKVAHATNRISRKDESLWIPLCAA